MSLTSSHHWVPHDLTGDGADELCTWREGQQVTSHAYSSATALSTSLPAGAAQSSPETLAAGRRLASELERERALTQQQVMYNDECVFLSIPQQQNSWFVFYNSCYELCPLPSTQEWADLPSCHRCAAACPRSEPV